mmetsp:Transcript_70976/g.203418  ORF Transcript_70976/g.203418 Transcript_70976/m.203418 type:complete len:264 (-) Transcript_70976:1181-1972(-)
MGLHVGPRAGSPARDALLDLGHHVLGDPLHVLRTQLLEQCLDLLGDPQRLRVAAHAQHRVRGRVQCRGLSEAVPALPGQDHGLHGRLEAELELAQHDVALRDGVRRQALAPLVAKHQERGARPLGCREGLHDTSGRLELHARDHLERDGLTSSVAQELVDRQRVLGHRQCGVCRIRPFLRRVRPDADEQRVRLRLLLAKLAAQGDCGFNGLHRQPRLASGQPGGGHGLQDPGSPTKVVLAAAPLRLRGPLHSGPHVALRELPA